MTAHELARLLLAGPDLPIAFDSTMVGGRSIAPPLVSPIRVPVGGGMVDCLLIGPEGREQADDDDDDDPLYSAGDLDRSADFGA